MILKEHGKPIEPGSYISPKTIETVLKVSHNLTAYGLALLPITTAIETLVQTLTGRRYWVRQSRSGLRFLSAAEAAQHYQDTYDAGMRKMDHAHTKAEVVVDPYLDELTEQEKEYYKSVRERNARMLLHMKESGFDEIQPLIEEEDEIQTENGKEETP